MSDEWVTRCWEQREDPHADANKPPLSDYKQLPFMGCTIGLRGFSAAEEEDMHEIANSNGASIPCLTWLHSTLHGDGMLVMHLSDTYCLPTVTLPYHG